MREIKRHFRFRGFATNIEINNSNTHTSFGAWSPVHARARRGIAKNLSLSRNPVQIDLAETADRQTESTQVQTRVAPVAAAHPPELDAPIGRPLPLGSALDASRAAWVGRNRATVTPRPRSRTDGDRGDGVSTLHRRERRP